MKNTMQFINAFVGKPLLLEAATFRVIFAALDSSAVAVGLADAVLSWDAAWKRVVSAKTNQDGLAMKTKLPALFAEAPKETAVLPAKAGTQIRSTIDGRSAEEVNPLMADAKKRAAVHEARK